MGAGRSRAWQAWLPEHLATRVTLVVVLVVVTAGLVTAAMLERLVVRSLGEELDARGRTLTIGLGEAVANSLADPEPSTVQETLNRATGESPDVVYAFAYGPQTPIIHTFPNGFPSGLLRVVGTSSAPEEVRLLQTEQGPIRDYMYRPLGELPAEVHVGISEDRISAATSRVTAFVVLLTLVGCVFASLVALYLSRITLAPLVDLTHRVERLGQGDFDAVAGARRGGEVGRLAEAFEGMATQIRESMDRLRASERARTVLLGQVIQTQEEERQRVARELHDGIGQSLSAVVLGLNTVAEVVNQSPVRAAAMVDTLRVSASDAVKELQTVIHDLRPSLLDDLGLLLALQWYARERLEPQGIRVSFAVTGDLALCRPRVETGLFRIAQEAFTNILRHADAHEVQVQLALCEGVVTMEISDDGVGFDVHRVAADRRGGHGGWGLLGMRERAFLLDGELQVTSHPGTGTQVRVRLPVGTAEP